jgi:hypothetical protein
MSKVEYMAGEEELQHEEARQQEGVHNHPASQLQRRICYSTILPETMVTVPVISVAVLRIRDPVPF